MPKVKKDLHYKKQYTEEHMQAALNAVRNGMSRHAASKQYSIPKSTLLFRLNNQSVKNSYGPAPVLGTDGENELVTWIIECSKKGFPRRKENVQASVKDYLDHSGLKNPFRNNIPGDGWYKSFLRRNPILAERFAESVTGASSCVSESDIRKWFKDIHEYLSKENYLDILKDPTRVYNGDETYFNVCPKMKNVLAPRGSKNVYEIEKGNSKLNLTVMFTFSASGVTTPPTVVYPYTRLPSAVGRSVPDTWGIGVTPNGWMKHELFIEYLVKIFHPYLIKENVTFPVILFVDGHTSHMSLEVSKVCDELQIILICLYPNSTRMLQPADVASFKPLKSLWKKSVVEWRQQNPTENITLELIAPILKIALEKLSPEVTKNGFKACGLYPWNPDAVDYSKCLAPTKEHPQNTQHVNQSNTGSISYESYAAIVGDKLLQKLDSFNPEVFIYLFKEGLL